MLNQFKDFLDSLIVESLHPELSNIVSSNTSNKSKQSQLASKIKDLTSRGEKTGIEGNMPKGSSRAYLQHAEPHSATVDNKPTSFKVGTKVAIKSALDAYHSKANHGGLSLGQMQNHVENGDSYVDHHRILTKDEHGNFHTNHDSGIFPPLVHHDEKNNEHSTVGHSRDLQHRLEFHKLTKNESHPRGISHDDFVAALVRHHDKSNGRHWGQNKTTEKHLDKVDTHPLVQKFQDFHTATGHPPHDYAQMKNMGVFEHPDGSEHIVARDHGFSNEVASAYADARKRKFNRY